MIINAKVARLYRHYDNVHFERLITQIEAATEEGLDRYELDVQSLEGEMLEDLEDALIALDYNTEVDIEGGLLYVSLP